ncbi:MAG: S53 family peptidase [Candidatus Baltobacteraceae bacterium]
MNRALILAVAAATFSLAATSPPAFARARTGHPVGANGSNTIVAHVPLVVRVSKYLGPAGLLSPVRLVVHLPYPHPDQVAQFVRMVNDPSSPIYHHYLTQKQFGKAFGPDPHWYTTVEYVLGVGGLQTINKYADHKILEVQGTVLAATLLFTTLVNEYQVGNLQYLANGLPAGLPLKLLGTIDAVAGFTTYALKLAQLPTVPNAIGYTPQQIQTAYDEPIVAHPSLTGKGVTIAIETAGDYLDSDLQSFWQQYGITHTGSIQRIVVSNPGQAHPRALPISEETTLDIEQVTASAPGANVIVYEGADATDGTFDAIYEQVLANPAVDIATTSFGSCEAAADPTIMAAENELFEEAAAEGKTTIAATGDTGAHDCGTNAPQFGHPGQPNPLTVDFPASSPYVVAGGGTTMRLDSKGAIGKETGWSGSGGGVSGQFGLPSYQVGIKGLGGKNGRNLPDVVLDANPNTPYPLVFEGSSLMTVGGTSAVAPNLAALYAQIVQATGNRQGLAQVGLYSALHAGKYPGEAFHDIVAGRNGHYRATRGYDNVTGVGSLDGNAFLALLQQSK